MLRPHRFAYWFAACCLLVVAEGIAAERVEVLVNERPETVVGKILVEAQDGGLLLLGDDGRIWPLQPDQIVDRSSDDADFVPLDKKGMIAAIEGQLPEGFDVHQTAHYLVFFNTSRGYAQWCGSLYERLHRAFYNFWKRRGLKLRPPDTPLVAIVFDRRQQYEDFSRDELKGAVRNVIGYYSMKTNWITTYDLTGLENLRVPGHRARTSTVINQILSRPEAAPNVATLVHEATHQIAFNCGMQNRYADNPLWLSEGLALFFEVPDLSNAKGWKGVGSVNFPRLYRFQETHAQRSAQSIKSLLVRDDLLRNPDSAITGYAESWALCYFLIKRRQKQFVKYLQAIGEQPLLVPRGPEQRYAQFREYFGSIEQMWPEFSSFVMTANQRRR